MGSKLIKQQHDQGSREGFGGPTYLRVARDIKASDGDGARKEGTEEGLLLDRSGDEWMPATGVDSFSEGATGGNDEEDEVRVSRPW